MYKKKFLKSRLILIILLAFILFLPTVSMAADPLEDPNEYKPNNFNTGDANVIVGRANDIITIIVNVGIIAPVITLMVLGIKYMVGSVEEKAEYKKSMIPYLIGAILLFAASGIIAIIFNLVEGTDLL